MQERFVQIRMDAVYSGWITAESDEEAKFLMSVGAKDAPLTLVESQRIGDIKVLGVRDLCIPDDFSTLVG